jgi:5'-nucleotidase/UDP-sugar diphosphatase
MRRSILAMCAAVFVSALAVLPAGAIGQAPAGPVTITIVHLNDVYEILPVEGGKSGGLARVATVIARLKQSNAPVLTTLGGDYLSPSALGTARVDGQPLAGRQMVDVLNAAGLDWATFGNHEFDVSEAAFRAHLTQAKFRIVSSDVTDAADKPFPGVPTSVIVPVTIGTRTVRLGIIGVTIGSTKKPWVRYRDPIEAAREETARLRGKVDAIIALTHLSLGQDADFVAGVPDVDLVLGGHEHENWLAMRGPRLVPIIKADANVRTLAIVSLAFGAEGAKPVVSTRLQVIDDAIPSAPAVEALARQWTEKGFEGFRREGFTPEAVVARSSDPLDGREATVRNRTGLLTEIITNAIAREVKQADVAIFNGGSVRIDDVVPPGPITEYDIIRILPFGGKVLKAVFDGALLARVLDTGMNNQGLGGYLHVWGARWENGAWTVQGKPVSPEGRYTVALTDFLLSGGEVNLGFLTRANPQVRDVQEFRDIRRAMIEELAIAFPSKAPGKRD